MLSSSMFNFPTLLVNRGDADKCTGPKSVSSRVRWFCEASLPATARVTESEELADLTHHR